MSVANTINYKGQFSQQLHSRNRFDRDKAFHFCLDLKSLTYWGLNLNIPTILWKILDQLARKVAKSIDHVSNRRVWYHVLRNTCVCVHIIITLSRTKPACWYLRHVRSAPEVFLLRATGERSAPRSAAVGTRWYFVGFVEEKNAKEQLPFPSISPFPSLPIHVTDQCEFKNAFER